MEQKGRAHSDTLIAVTTHEHLALGQSAMMTVVWQPQPESNADILLRPDCSPRPQLLLRTSQTPARQAHIRSLCSNVELISGRDLVFLSPQKSHKSSNKYAFCTPSEGSDRPQEIRVPWLRNQILEEHESGSAGTGISKGVEGGTVASANADLSSAPRCSQRPGLAPGHSLT